MKREADAVVQASVVPVRTQDVDRLCALAGELWRRHYPGIISAAQIEFMLQQRYDPQVVRAELERGDIWWDQLLLDGTMAGFSSYFVLAASNAMKVDKLYVHHDRQRRGYGGMLLDRAVAIARGRGCRSLVLAVNKRNRPALAAYDRYGFSVAEAVIKEIGGGFVMDDYVLVKHV